MSLPWRGWITPFMWGRGRWRWTLDTAYWLRAVCFVSALIENESLARVAMEMMPSHVESWKPERHSGDQHACQRFLPPTHQPLAFSCHCSSAAAAIVRPRWPWWSKAMQKDRSGKKISITHMQEVMALLWQSVKNEAGVKGRKQHSLSFARLKARNSCYLMKQPFCVV